MSIALPKELILLTESPRLERTRAYAQSVSRTDIEIKIESKLLDDQVLADVRQAAVQLEDNKTIRAVDAIARAGSGLFDKAVPNFKAFESMLKSYLAKDVIDGWVYVKGSDDMLYPELVLDVSFHVDSGYKRKDIHFVTLTTMSYGFHFDNNGQPQVGAHTIRHRFDPGMVSNRRMQDILANADIYKETQELKDHHLEVMERHSNVTCDGFSKQFRLNGKAYYHLDAHYHRQDEEFLSRRVIHDLDQQKLKPVQPYAESFLFEDRDDLNGAGQVPEKPIIKIFDLLSHEFLWVHANTLEPYNYDKSLREKLVLPKSHRDLLDVLTTDVSAFTADIIEGKSAGNVILCKGLPGVGKTLTAEVYSELIERPLYRVHAGTLGTTAQDIAKGLKVVFERSKRWDCVLLIDEADVFVMRRGENIEQNAIVSEFLQIIEYFDGLLFMTTNRPNDIDDAMISRCAAIIDYPLPAPDDAAKIWRVMSHQFEASLSESLIRMLVQTFPEIAPRDIKMLFRLALRVAATQKVALDIEVFRQCAMFRAIKMVA